MNSCFDSGRVWLCGHGINAKSFLISSGYSGRKGSISTSRPDARTNNWDHKSTNNPTLKLRLTWTLSLNLRFGRRWTKSDCWSRFGGFWSRSWFQFLFPGVHEENYWCKHRHSKLCRCQLCPCFTTPPWTRSSPLHPSESTNPTLPNTLLTLNPTPSTPYWSLKWLSPMGSCKSDPPQWCLPLPHNLTWN